MNAWLQNCVKGVLVGGAAIGLVIEIVGSCRWCVAAPIVSEERNGGSPQCAGRER